jgi:hypothetical protein
MDIAEIGWYVWSGIIWFSTDSSEVSDEYSCFIKDRTLSHFLSDRPLPWKRSARCVGL